MCIDIGRTYGYSLGNVLAFQSACNEHDEEHRGSVVDCSTRERGVAGSSLTAGLIKTLYPLLSTRSTQKDPPRKD